jgi:hypothetical protein
VIVFPSTGCKLFRESLESDGLFEATSNFLIGLLLEDEGSPAFNYVYFLLDRGLMVAGFLFGLYKIIRIKNC